MGITKIHQGDNTYPVVLEKYLDNHAPKSIATLGNIDILQAKTLALFCSVKCPGSLILKTYDLTQALKQAGIPVIGGFHSPIERECLRILLGGTQPIIICPARSIEGMRIPREYKQLLEQGCLLLLSPFTQRQYRATVQTALYRNRFVAALANCIFVAYAEANSKTEHFCRDVVARQKPLYTLDNEANRNLIELGAKPVSLNDIHNWI